MLARLLPQRETTLANYNGSQFWSLPGGFGLTESAYNDTKGVEQALRNAASWACIRVLSDALARTPINAVREIGNIRTPVEPVPRILARPSALVAPDVWRGQLGFSILTDGNWFARISDEDSAGRPIMAESLDPVIVTDRKVVNGVAQVSVNHGAPEKLWPFGDIWHIPGDMVMPGTPFGTSPVEYAKTIIGTSLSAEDFGLRFFNDGGHPPIALISEEAMNSTQAQEYKDKYQQATNGKREPLVMGSGMTLKELHLDPSETMFIDLMRFCVEQACRFWGVPPSMIFSSISGQHMTYANVTQADLHFLKHALEGKFIRLEHAFSEVLPGNSYTAPSVPNTIALCDRNAVLKPDVKSRYDAYALGLQNQFLTVNEVRTEEGDAPFADPKWDLPTPTPPKPTLTPPNQTGIDNG